MKRAAIMIVVVYGIIFLALTYAIPIISFLGTETKIEPLTSYKEIPFWVWFLVFILSQIALLIIPVKTKNNRPVTKRTVIFPIIAASLMTGFLALGAYVSIAELVQGEASYNSMWWFGWGEFILMWALWALIFHRWSKNTEPRNFIEKLTGVLYRGSLLELLIAVPTHIIVRQRTYCCAGAATFVGISIGIAVMVFAFGPAVFFLYADRARRKNRKT